MDTNFSNLRNTGTACFVKIIQSSELTDVFALHKKQSNNEDRNKGEKNSEESVA